MQVHQAKVVAIQSIQSLVLQSMQMHQIVTMHEVAIVQLVIMATHEALLVTTCP
jgi:hypothetical protein